MFRTVRTGSFLLLAFFLLRWNLSACTTREVLHQPSSFAVDAIPQESHWKEKGVVLTANPSGSWDARLNGQISPCGFVKKDGFFYLYYIGADGDRSTDGGPRHRALGVAMSADGINFEKYNGNPIIIYLPHQNEEEGVFSCSATLAANGDVVLYYGALRAPNSTSKEVDIDIRMMHSSNGLDFAGDTLIRSESGQELTPLGTFQTDAGWHTYYIGPLAGGDGPLRLLSGPSRDDLPNKTNVLSSSFDGGGDPVWLNSEEIALFLQKRQGDDKIIEVRTAHPDEPEKLSSPVVTYPMGDDWAHSTVFYDKGTGKWLMFYRLDEGNTIRLKTAELTDTLSTKWYVFFYR